jgi:hypothetical protein
MYGLRVGDVVRIQPNHLSFTNPDAIRDIHGFKAVAKRGALYRNLMQPPSSAPEVRENLLSTTFDFLKRF